MFGLFIIMIGLVALPFLFPEVVIHWLNSIQAQLVERRARKDREIAQLETLCDAHSEWAKQLADLRHGLVRAVGQSDHSHNITQALAAGERYLQEIDHHTFPQLYAKTEQLSGALRARLQQQLVVNGLERVTLVGLPDAAVRESSERVRSAISEAQKKGPGS